MDDSTKLENTAELTSQRNNNISNSRIKNTDNLIQSISYYDQIYSNPKDNINLPPIHETVIPGKTDEGS
jgi:hypothetical protein